jgi:glycosyltransferase involved in cell wall biosynthesis
MVSIVIPVYNDPRGIETTVRTFVANNPERDDCECIVVNDGACDEVTKTVVRMKELLDNVREVKVYPNRGSYNARNEGIRTARGSYIAFLDAGVFVQKNWYTCATTYAREYDYVAGNVKIPLEWAGTAGEKFNAITGFPVASYMRRFHFGVTANLVTSRKVFDEVGLFDERLRSHGDLEFGDRVFNAGLSQIFAKDMMVYHAPRSLEDLGKKTIRLKTGIKDLMTYYPERFSWLRERISRTSFFRYLSTALLMPFTEESYRKAGISSIQHLGLVTKLAKYELEANRIARNHTPEGV